MTGHKEEKQNHSPVLTQKDLEMINKMWADQNQTDRKGKRELLRRKR